MTRRSIFDFSDEYLEQLRRMQELLARPLPPMSPAQKARFRALMDKNLNARELASFARMSMGAIFGDGVKVKFKHLSPPRKRSARRPKPSKASARRRQRTSH